MPITYSVKELNLRFLLFIFPFGSPFTFLAVHLSTGTVSAKDTKRLELLEVTQPIALVLNLMTENVSIALLSTMTAQVK